MKFCCKGTSAIHFHFKIQQTNQMQDTFCQNINQLSSRYNMSLTCCAMPFAAHEVCSQAATRSVNNLVGRVVHCNPFWRLCLQLFVSETADTHCSTSNFASQMLCTSLWKDEGQDLSDQVLIPQIGYSHETMMQNSGCNSHPAVF